MADYERSEGEIGFPFSEEDMQSEMRFPSNPRSVGLVDRNRQGFGGQQQRSVTPNEVVRPSRHDHLGQTYEYEENKAAIGDSEIERPVYDSSDGPVPKGGRANGARGAKEVFVSGDSFGGQKAFKGNGRAAAAGAKREAIGETFLEDDDNYSEGEFQL